MMDVEEILENMEDPETLKKFLKDSKTAIHCQQMTVGMYQLFVIIAQRYQ
jgi:hypothetical protein